MSAILGENTNKKKWVTYFFGSNEHFSSEFFILLNCKHN